MVGAPILSDEVAWFGRSIGSDRLTACRRRLLERVQRGRDLPLA